MSFNSVSTLSASVLQRLHVSVRTSSSSLVDAAVCSFVFEVVPLVVNFGVDDSTLPNAQCSQPRVGCLWMAASGTARSAPDDAPSAASGASTASPAPSSPSQPLTLPPRADARPPMCAGGARGGDASVVVQPARIKAMMRADKEIGQILAGTPVAVTHALTAFTHALVTHCAAVCRAEGVTAVTPQILCVRRPQQRS